MKKGDSETSVESLTLTITSSITNVVPNVNLSLSGTGVSRNLKNHAYWC